jgi:hypothetical protein
MMKDAGFKSLRKKRRFRMGSRRDDSPPHLSKLAFEPSGSHGSEALYQGTTLVGP